MALICERDEQWSFVGCKALHHRLWYAYNTKTGVYQPILRFTHRELPAPLTPLSIGIGIGIIICNDRDSYVREISKDKHLTGKIFTQCIEHNNLTLPTRMQCVSQIMLLVLSRRGDTLLLPFGHPVRVNFGFRSIST
ncbi:hypothetical protein I1A41_08415 [Pectobacterium carotovorum]|nr:hypothetical protein [Pectobacterium carotovorum]